MVKITGIECGSLAQKKGIKVGDTLLSINGNEISDVLDYRFYLTEKVVVVTVERGNRKKSVRIKKGEYDDIGLEFESALMDEKHSCRNGCIFCFIDQNPKGLRDTLYFKDDDSRLSFIHGNYITLTNMSEEDVRRIVKMRISPINISVHTTNPELRVRMMKNKRSGEVLKYLDDFRSAGLKMHGQIVLCRGVNDGDELRRTLSDLADYYPYMDSVSIVPAGLTKHREGLYPLSDFTRDEARDIISIVDEYAEKQLSRYGSRQFFSADELYLKAELPLPPTEYYEEYPQIENGVGMLRSFSDELGVAVSDIERALPRVKDGRVVTVATGAASFDMISASAGVLERLCPKIKINVVRIINNFFGESVTVSGLLTGKDICEQLSGREIGDILLLPSSCLRHGDELFLCGTTLTELKRCLGCEVRTVDNDGYDFAEAILGVTLCE